MSIYTRCVEKVKEYGMDSNTLYGFASKGIAMILFFAADITLARLLPISIYGEWMLFFSIMTLCFCFGWMGINSSVRIYAAIEREKNESLLTCFKSALSLRVISSILFATIFFFASPIVIRLIGLHESLQNYSTLFRLGAVLLFLNSMSEFFKGLWIGIQKQKYLFWQTLIELAFLFIFIIWFVWIYRSSISIEMSYIVSLGLSVTFGFILLRFYIKKNNVSDSIAAPRFYWKRVLRLAIPLWLLSFGYVINLEIGAIMMGYMLTVEEVAVYNVARRLPEKALHINVTYVLSVTPIFAVITRENIDERVSRFKKICLANIVLTFSVIVVLLAGGQILIPFLYGTQYTASVSVLYILIPYYLFTSVFLVFSTFVEYQRKLRARNIAFLLTLALNILFCYLLIPKYGAYGAAIATSISIIPFTLILIVISYRILNSYRKRN